MKMYGPEIREPLVRRMMSPENASILELSRETTLSMIFKLAQSAEKRWQRINGYKLLGEVTRGVVFKDGLPVTEQSGRDAA